MKTVTTKLYSFDELSDEAKERAIQKSIEGWEFCWGDEWRESLEGFLKVVPCHLNRNARVSWSVGLCSPSYCDVTPDEDAIGEMVGVRLWKYLHNYGVADAIAKECPFTGYCGDESILKPLRDFLAKPSLTITGEELFQDCANAWVTDWVADMEYQVSEEYHRELLSDNDEEIYTESGETF